MPFTLLQQQRHLGSSQMIHYREHIIFEPLVAVQPQMARLRLAGHDLFRCTLQNVRS